MKHAVTPLRKKPAAVTQSEIDAVWAEFPAESDLAKRAASPAPLVIHRRLILTAVGVLLAIGAAIVAWGASGSNEASLRIESEPSGAPVRLNAQLRGVTPLAVNLAPGSYSVAIGEGAGAQERKITLGAAERASIYHVLSAPAAANAVPVGALAPAGRGALAVTTDPAGGTVTIDDVNHGVAPVVVQNLAPGEHQLVVRNQGAVYRRTVMLTAGNTSTVLVSGAPAASAGWLSVRVPLVLDVREAGRLVGTTAVDRLMLPTGTHQLEFSSAAAGFRATRTVRIDAGTTTTLAFDVPRMPVNVNAIPWGEVWIDDERVGETPIGNHMLTLGEHRIEIRHPELGVKQQTVTVTLGRANRIAVNMRER